MEVLWQGIAFQNEADIDRAAARAQCMAFLRSVFPKQFGAVESRVSGAESHGPVGVAAQVHAQPGAARARAGDVGAASAAVGTGASGGGAIGASSNFTRHLPASAYADAMLLTAERERLFRPAWQIVGHEAEMPGNGDFLAGELGSDRALVVRDAKGRVHAFRNACRQRPHALVSTRTGHFPGAIACAPHGLQWSLDGKVAGAGPADLMPLELKQKSGLILVRAPGAVREGGPTLTGWEGFAGLTPLGVQEFELAADWKLLVEQWLEGSRGVMEASQGRRFLAPNQLVESWEGGAVILRAIPVAPGRSKLQRLDYGGAGLGRKTGGAVSAGRKGSATAGSGAAPRKLLDTWIAQQVELAESTQTGLTAEHDVIVESGPVSAALAEFRGSIAALLPRSFADPSR
jgi:nitrite reductase/ring-hydroxylating ferredoxin subunit